MEREGVKVRTGQQPMGEGGWGAENTARVMGSIPEASGHSQDHWCTHNLLASDAVVKICDGNI